VDIAGAIAGNEAGFPDRKLES